MMTCLIAAEKLDLNDTITFSEEAIHSVPADGSNVGMDVGESITVEQAQQSLSDILTVDNTRLALIPTSGQNEVCVYEFLCTSPTGDRILSYINTQTGAEEQILILMQTPNGTLTK